MKEIDVQNTLKISKSIAKTLSAERQVFAFTSIASPSLPHFNIHMFRSSHVIVHPSIITSDNVMQKVFSNSLKSFQKTLWNLKTIPFHLKTKRIGKKLGNPTRRNILKHKLLNINNLSTSKTYSGYGRNCLHT